MDSYSFPREILKWVQSLGLSVAIKDVRRDFLNGYVAAEIISVYHKNVVSMHSFANSHNNDLKESNWLLLEGVFRKIGFKAKRDEFREVRRGDQNLTVAFMTRLFKFLTNRSVELQVRSRPVHGQTQTFLLTETGLENINIEHKKLSLRQNLGEKPEAETSKRTSFEEVETREKQSAFASEADEELPDGWVPHMGHAVGS